LREVAVEEREAESTARKDNVLLDQAAENMKQGRKYRKAMSGKRMTWHVAKRTSSCGKEQCKGAWSRSHESKK
jgi:hypothetical protein